MQFSRIYKNKNDCVNHFTLSTVFVAEGRITASVFTLITDSRAVMHYANCSETKQKNAAA